MNLSGMKVLSIDPGQDRTGGAPGMRIWNIYYDGEFIGEDTLSDSWSEARVEAVQTVRQRKGDIDPTLVQIRRVK